MQDIAWHASRTVPGADLENFVAVVAASNLAAARIIRLGFYALKG
jgi:hypothetical protein